MTHKALTVVLILTACSTAAAQSYPPPPPTYAYLQRPPTVDDLLREDPEFQAARSRRRAGILLATIGPGVGLAAAGFGMYNWDMCEDDHAPEGCSDTGYKIVAVAGYVVAGLSLLIGIPTAISGQREVSALREAKLRELLPRVSLAPAPGGGHLQAAWRF